MKAYIASGWFNEKQKEDLSIIKGALRAYGIKFFSPKDEIICPPNADARERDKVFRGNVNAIVECDFMICNTRDKDMGSIFESGVAYKCNKPIIFYCSGLPDGASFNLMLAEAGIAVATNTTSLSYVLGEIKTNINWKQKYKGVIE